MFGKNGFTGRTDARFTTDQGDVLGILGIFQAKADRGLKAFNVRQQIGKGIAAPLLPFLLTNQEIMANVFHANAALHLFDPLKEQVAPAVAHGPLAAGADGSVLREFAMAPNARQRQVQLLHQPGDEMGASAQLGRGGNTTVHKAAGKDHPHRVVVVAVDMVADRLQMIRLFNRAVGMNKVMITDAGPRLFVASRISRNMGLGNARRV